MAGNSSIYLDIDRRRRRALSTGVEDLSRRYQFYDTDDLGDVAPQGLPSIAVMQTQYSNTGAFRTFEHLHWRQLGFLETKLSYLEGQLYRLDVAEAEKMEGSQKCKLPFNKRSFVDCCFGDSDPIHISETLESDQNMLQDEFNDIRENLYTHIECISKKHRELVEWLHKASKFPRVPRQVHSQLFTAAQECHGLSMEAIERFRAIDEMAYVNFNPTDSKIQSMWLSGTSWIKTIIRRLYAKGNLPDNGGSQIYHIVEADAFVFLGKATTAILSSLLILIPAGILYLAGLSRPLSFVVVVVFDVVFAVALVHVERRIGHAVVGAIAYIAVLATFLASVT